jgi:hypothetical protein
MEELTLPCVPQEQSSTNTLPFPHLASPSPWLVAGSVDTTVHVHEHDHHRRSFSAVEPQAAACSDHYTVVVAGGGGYQHHHGSARYAVEEDKMDMLWEDFNEELTRAAPLCPLAKGTPWMTPKEAWLAGEDDDCVPAETRKRAVVRRKRMGLLAMLRLLEKLFLAHKSGAAASGKTPPI